ncbi:MAG: hypothetical protein WC919_00955 [Candidatus Paceibacterota bacterium]
MVQLDENQLAEIIIPLCPWCEEPLTGRSDGGLHESCAAELAEAFQDA